MYHARSYVKASWRSFTFEALFAVLVVDLALLLVAEHLVGLCDFLEALFGARRLVLVGVKLERHFSVGLLDVVVGGRAGQPERLVIVLAHPHIV